jgi:hypothetical protein
LVVELPLLHSGDDVSGNPGADAGDGESSEPATPKVTQRLDMPSQARMFPPTLQLLPPFCCCDSSFSVHISLLLFPHHLIPQTLFPTVFFFASLPIF